MENLVRIGMVVGLGQHLNDRKALTGHAYGGFPKLCLVACGALAGWGVAIAARAALGFWVFDVPVWSRALGFGLGTLVGIAFGLAPAVRAARIVPLEARRAS